MSTDAHSSSSLTPSGPTDPPVAHEHRDVSGGWLRPSVFGVVDGLVSNFSLIAGVSAGTDTLRPVVLAGVAGLVAGAISMGSGEYLSVRSQNESMQAEVNLERRELKLNRRGEIAELAEIYIERGVDPELARKVSEQLSRDPEQALEVHVQEELGMDLNDLPSPIVAMVSSFISFSLGALLPLLPFLFGFNSLPVAAALALGGLFATGAVTSRYTQKSWWYAGVRQMFVGILSAAAVYGIGHLVGANVS